MLEGQVNYGNMAEEEFDYGEKRDDGQFENHPTIDEGEFKRPIRLEYKHNRCGGVTRMGRKLAESIARDPDYYDSTFCSKCGDYFPLEEFEWVDDGVTVGE